MSDWDLWSGNETGISDWDLWSGNETSMSHDHAQTSTSLKMDIAHHALQEGGASCYWSCSHTKNQSQSGQVTSSLPAHCTEVICTSPLGLGTRLYIHRLPLSFEGPVLAICPALTLAV